MIEYAKKLLQIESEAIRTASERIGEDFERALKIISQHHGKIVVCGMGKSGHIARKIAATFSSIGQQAVFLHPSEAAHGDLGVYSPGDPTILISKGGASDEILRLIPTLKLFNSPIIAIVGDAHSPIAESADVVIDISFAREADPLNMVPTTSAIVSLAIGDALAAELMHIRGITKTDFARYHPAGQLGRNLLLRVADVMQKLDKCARVNITDSLRKTVIEMTNYPLGAALVFDDFGKFDGIITDGDIRRSLQNEMNIDTLKVSDVAIKNPIVVSMDASLGDAIAIMECRKSQISVLPVIDPKNSKVVGLIRLHDVYKH